MLDVDRARSEGDLIVKHGCFCVGADCGWGGGERSVQSMARKVPSFWFTSEILAVTCFGSWTSAARIP